MRITPLSTLLFTAACASLPLLRALSLERCRYRMTHMEHTDDAFKLAILDCDFDEDLYLQSRLDGTLAPIASVASQAEVSATTVYGPPPRPHDLISDVVLHVVERLHLGLELVNLPLVEVLVLFQSFSALLHPDHVLFRYHRKPLQINYYCCKLLGRLRRRLQATTIFVCLFGGG